MQDCEVSEVLEQVVQRSGCPIPGYVQGQVGWGIQQPGKAECVPAQGRKLGTR